MANNETIEDVISSESMFINSDTEEIVLDEDDILYVDDYDDNEYYNYVGMDDPADFAKIYLESAANLSFRVNATDAAKFTIWSLVPGKNGGGTQKSLQATTLKFDLSSEFFTATTSPLLLEKGTYYLSVESTTAKTGGSAYYNVYVNHRASSFFEDVNDENNWNDMKTRGPASEQYDTIEDGLGEETWIEGWVGFGDPIDYYRFTIEGAANLCFSVGATDAAKFTIYSLAGTKGNYSLKSLQSTKLAKNSQPEPYYYDEEDGEYYYDDEVTYYAYVATTKSLLLERGSYYISMESTNAQKGGSAGYYFAVNGNSAFFDDVHDDNDWTDMKVKGPASEQYGDAGVVSSEDGLYLEDWVGFGDPVDYFRFSLSGAANLSFSIGATDAAKFTIYTLAGSKGNYSLKSLQSTSLAKNSQPRPYYYDEEDGEYYYDDEETYYAYVATTKSLLLERGNYYISVESTNAKKGGSAGYSVSVNDGGSAFFENVYDENNWNDMKTRGPASEQYDYIEGGLGEECEVEGWVGFGDPVDYYRFTLEGAANLIFNLNATDAAKFTIYSLTGSKGNYSLKSLQSTSLAKNNKPRPVYYDEEDGEYYYDEEETYYAYVATTKSLLLERGSYYFSVESTNAKKGGSADYFISVNGNSAFFEDVHDDNNWTDMKTNGPRSELYDTLEDGLGEGIEVEGWVGFGDPVDYYRFTLNGPAKLSFNLNATDAAKFTIYSLAGSKGNYSLKSLQSTSLAKNSQPRPVYYDEEDGEYYYDEEETYYAYVATTKSLLLEKGSYYFSVESTNAKKGGSAGYDISTNWKDTAFFEDVQDGNNWNDLKTKGARSEQYGNLESITYESDLLIDDWVGFGDPIDYFRFTIDGVAKLSFSIDAMDAAKFTVYSLAGSIGKYSLKSLQSTTLAKRSGPVYDEDYDEDYDVYYEYGATTKPLLLESGHYFIAVESTNAKKGGNAGYAVSVNWRDSAFFEDVQDDNNWGNLARAGRSGDVDDLEEIGYETDYSGWVGFGDPIDYAVFEVSTPASSYSQNAAVLCFNIEATDSVKVTIYSLVEKITKTNEKNYSLKSLQSTTTKQVSSSYNYEDEDGEIYDFVATTKSLTIKTRGYYAISVQSTNADKGGSASYRISVNEDFTDFFDYDYNYAALPGDGQDFGAPADSGTEYAGLDGWTDLSALDGGVRQGGLLAGPDSAQDGSLSSVAASLESSRDTAIFGETGRGMLASL